MRMAGVVRLFPGAQESVLFEQHRDRRIAKNEDTAEDAFPHHAQNQNPRVLGNPGGCTTMGEILCVSRRF